MSLPTNGQILKCFSINNA
jgi:hypothetical protein